MTGYHSQWSTSLRSVSRKGFSAAMPGTHLLFPARCSLFTQVQLLLVDMGVCLEPLIASFRKAIECMLHA